ncbi:hypothetical protein CS053_03820 [Rhodanobacter glycinis]|uniref:Uncharacterized protein n=1 Tax=Rhodanobacter glycinis TaxID=582702 RepID=A0A5B9DYC5_9GAMM|nr:hypothetical protein [Rhodanobacter glycinis]QEE23735.1 hypothetical protein CS053_03820 [Rhodanobacter glycinis]
MAEETSLDAEEGFEYALRIVLNSVSAIATGAAEGRPFSYFIAYEYLWEIKQDVPWVTEAPTSYLSDFEKAALRRFVEGVPTVIDALKVAQRRHPDNPAVPVLPAWPDWRLIPALPAWNILASRATTLISQLSGAIRRNNGYFAKLG